MSADHAHATPEVAEIAVGSLEAQQLVDAIIEGRLEPAHAWLAYCELAARHGRTSVACASFIKTLAMRVRPCLAAKRVRREG